jgi:hypothetical protein
MCLCHLCLQTSAHTALLLQQSHAWNSGDDQKLINNELTRMLNEATIEESNSSWRAQVLVTSNENHKKRMVIDYSQTINKFTQLDAYPLPHIEEMVGNIAQYNIFSTLDLTSAYHQVPIKEEEKKYTAFEANHRLYQFCRIPFGVTNGVASFQRIIDSVIDKEKLDATFAYIDNVTVCGITQENHDANLQKFMTAVRKYKLTLNLDKCTLNTKKVELLGYTIENKIIKPDPDRMRPLMNLPAPQNTNSLKRVMGMFAHFSKWISGFSEKIRPLVDTASFPLSPTAILAFEQLKKDIAASSISAVDPSASFTVETDASEHSIGATLSQSDRPVAFFSRTLTTCEQKHSAVEKEAYAIVEALKKWRHYLLGRRFQLITDQKSVSFMFSRSKTSKIKNEKITRWRIELACFHYDIVYREGKQNVTADVMSRLCGATMSNDTLYKLHNDLCHPGITRMMHFVRSKNLPFSVNDIKLITSGCSICSQVKPRFDQHEGHALIKATQPFERIGLDFKGPLPSTNKNKYILTVVDEYSRFPFAFPCADVSTKTVIQCLCQLFSLFGMPAYIHSDRGAAFMSDELKQFLTSKGIAASRSSPYNPRGNGQVERYNGIIWKTITLSLKSQNLPTEGWEMILPDALHSIRSLLCTATNCTPHERLFNYQRRSSTGRSIPTWLSNPGSKVLLKRAVRTSKYDPLVEEVELIQANPDYAYIKYPDGRDSTVSLRRLAPADFTGDVLRSENNQTKAHSFDKTDFITDCNNDQSLPNLPHSVPIKTPMFCHDGSDKPTAASEQTGQTLRRSDRTRKPPKYFHDE